MLVCLDCDTSFSSWSSLQHHQWFGQCATPPLSTLAGALPLLTAGVYVDPEVIARVVHEAHRALQVELGEDAISPPWDEAPEWLRAGTLAGVQEALDGAAPWELHETWCARRFADGWRYGAVKDAQAKTHPLLRDYDMLPDDQRRKDELMASIVATLR